jgi:hypothetical protein
MNLRPFVGFRDRFHAAMGDDMLVQAKNAGEAVAMVETMRALLPVNPSKFFIKRGVTEFLRYVVDESGRRGYFWRVLSHMTHKHTYVSGVMTASSQASNWSVLYSRGALESKVMKHMVRDLCGLLQCGKAKVLGLLATPSSVGGLGYKRVKVPELYSDKWIVQEDEPTIKLKWYEERVTPIDKLPVEAVNLARKNVKDLIGPGDFAPSVVAAAADTLLGGVKPKDMKMENPRGRVLRVIPKGTFHRGRPAVSVTRMKAPLLEFAASTGFKLSGRRQVNLGLGRPTLTVDAMYADGMLRESLKIGGEAWTALVCQQDVPVARARKRLWSRRVWCDWLLGRLDFPVGKTLGVSGDSLDYVKRVVGLPYLGHLAMRRLRKEHLRMLAYSYEIYTTDCLGWARNALGA